MSGRTVVTLQQRSNIEVASTVLWPSVPKSNVTRMLRASSDLTTNKKTVTDFGGWCARWPDFIRQGARLGHTGHIEWVLRNGQTFTSPQYASHSLFGVGGMFLARNHLWIDHQFINHTDHEVVAERLRWWLRASITRQMMEDE